MAAAPSATALAEQGGRLVAKATLHFRDECNLSPAVLKVELPWEVTGTIITDRVICFKDWGGWTDAEKDAVKRRQERSGRKSSIDSERLKWQEQERERRQSELSEELHNSEAGSDSEDTDSEEGDDDVRCSLVGIGGASILPAPHAHHVSDSVVLERRSVDSRGAQDDGDHRSVVRSLPDLESERSRQRDAERAAAAHHRGQGRDRCETPLARCRSASTDRMMRKWASHELGRV